MRKKINLKKDRIHLSTLRFAGDVVLFREKAVKMEMMITALSRENVKDDLRINMERQN